MLDQFLLNRSRSWINHIEFLRPFRMLFVAADKVASGNDRDSGSTVAGQSLVCWQEIRLLVKLVEDVLGMTLAKALVSILKLTNSWSFNFNGTRASSLPLSLLMAYKKTVSSLPIPASTESVSSSMVHSCYCNRLSQNDLVFCNECRFSLLLGMNDLLFFWMAWFLILHTMWSRIIWSGSVERHGLANVFNSVMYLSVLLLSNWSLFWNIYLANSRFFWARMIFKIFKKGLNFIGFSLSQLECVEDLPAFFSHPDKEECTMRFFSLICQWSNKHQLCMLFESVPARNQFKPIQKNGLSQSQSLALQPIQKNGLSPLQYLALYAKAFNCLKK